MRPRLIVVLAGLCLLPGARCVAQGDAATKVKLMHATGTFEVKVLPAEPSEVAKAAGTGRMTLDKTWAGDMTGTSKGEMLTGVTKENASMAYVAMERFTGTVGGRGGTLLFSHTAFMLNNQRQPGDMTVSIVPGSGTGELAGISGQLDIQIEGGVHRYDLAYTLTGKH